MGGFERICWILTILASIAAIAILGTALFGHQLAAADQPGLAVAGAGIAIVPYIFTRAIQALGRDARRRAAVRSLPAALAAVAVPADELALRRRRPPSRLWKNRRRREPSRWSSILRPRRCPSRR
jgi:hypothetical protein